MTFILTDTIFQGKNLRKWLKNADFSGIVLNTPRKKEPHAETLLGRVKSMEFSEKVAFFWKKVKNAKKNMNFLTFFYIYLNLRLKVEI